MKGIFSIDDFSDPFWEVPPPPPFNLDSDNVVMAEEVNHSEPEWTFETFLDEISSLVSSEPVENSNAIVGVSSAQSFHSVSRQYEHDHDSGNWDCAALPPTVTFGSDEYDVVLKNSLETDFSTSVAFEAGSMKPEDSNTSPGTLFQPSQSTHLAQGSLMIPGEFGVSSSLPAELKEPGVALNQAMNGSLGEYSDEDDLDDENETTASLKPEDVRKSRRKLSNRESARRSRKRKQEQTSDLETQLIELQAEHSALLRQLSNVNHVYDEAAVGNRILKADIETLRVKVKMAEETVKRETGMDPVLLGRPKEHNNNNNNNNNSRMPLNRMDSSCIPAFQPQSNLNHLPNPNIRIPTIQSPRLENSFIPPPSLNSQTKSDLQRIINEQNHHVAPSNNPYGWNAEPQNDSAWQKK